MHRSISIKNSRGIKLVGLIDFPKLKRKKHSAIILVHGFNMAKDEAGMYDALSDILTENGYLVFRFDFAGCGESGGQFINESLSKEVEDLRKIVSYVKLRKDVGRVGILARSFGTASTIILNPEVSAIILSSSAGNHLETLPMLFGKNWHPRSISWRKRGDGRITKIKSDFIDDIKKYNMYELIKKIHVPVMLLHGDKDTKIHFRNTIQLAKNANKPKKEIIIKGMGHNWEPGQIKESRAVLGWFKKYL